MVKITLPVPLSITIQPTLQCCRRIVENIGQYFKPCLKYAISACRYLAYNLKVVFIAFNIPGAVQVPGTIMRLTVNNGFNESLLPDKLKAIW